MSEAPIFRGAPGGLVTFRVMGRPKAGHLEHEYEDAHALPASPVLPCRIAVADGATESAYARDWARLLAEGYVDHVDDDFAAWLEARRRIWSDGPARRTAGIPWYAAAKRDEGAHATFLGLTLAPGGRWAATAVGDCCLFHIRAGESPTSWPLSDPDAFDHRPKLLGSIPGTPYLEPDRAAGSFLPGDRFLLATDAVAAWLMRAGVEPALAWTPDTFSEAADRARRDGLLRNDDLTLVAVAID